MLNIIPRFIQQQLDRKPEITSGSFNGSVLFVDIAGFTKITEKLMSRGHRGAEELSVLINRVYKPLIDRVYAIGGHVAVFAGDSITAVFPEMNCREVTDAARNINTCFRRRNMPAVEVRTGLSSGLVRWSVFGRKRNAYLYHGDAVLESSMAVKGTKPGTLAISEKAAELSGISRLPLLPKRIKPTIAGRFVPEKILAAKHSGEFRRVAAVFIRFSENQIESKVNKVLELAEITGGWVNGLFQDDKGTHALVVFGAPVSRENDYQRASLFASRLATELKSGIAAGIAGGTVYAGAVGTTRRCTYTILGDRVNQAARLMQRASWGQVIASEEIENCKSSKGTCSIMVGREDELNQLKDWCTPILEGSSAGVFTVAGAAGMGKSMLLENLPEKLPEYVKTLVMQTDQILQKSLNPFEYLISNYFGTTDESFNSIWNNLISELKKSGNLQVMEELVRSEPFIRVLAGLTTDNLLYASLDPRGRFTNTVFALKAFIRGLCILSPLVLVLEDVHWLDSDSREVLLNLTTNMESFPLAILTTVRPDKKGDIPELQTWYGSRTGLLKLEPLPEASETCLIENLLPGKPTEKLTAFILTRTEGNPFFAEQFCLYLMENRLLKTEHGTTCLTEGSVDIPEGVSAVVVARIDRLSAKLRETIKTASVLGREFDVQVLSAILSGKPRHLKPILNEGESEAVWNAVNEARYIFRHAILRDAAYSMQMSRELKKLHRQAAGVLSEVYGEDESRYSERAYHYLEAGLKDDAAVYLRKAAEHAVSQYRNQEALDLYRKLLTLCTSSDDKMKTELSIADLLVETGKRNEARDIINRNLQKAEELGSQWFIAQCSRELAKLDHRQGKNQTALHYINRAVNIFSSLKDTAKIASSLNILGNINTVLGNYDEALKNLAGSSEAAEKSGDQITIALNVSNVGNIYLYRYDLDKAEEYYRKGIRVCGEINDRKALANAFNNLAVVWYYRKDFNRCRKYLNEFVKISTEIGNMEGLAYIYGNLGILHRELGELNRSLEYHEKQAALAEELGDLYNTAKALQQKANIHCAQGDFHSAEKNLVTAVELCDRTGDQRTNSQASRDLGAVYIDMNLLSKAITTLNRACTLGEAGSDLEACSSSCSYLGQIALKQGRIKAAEDYAEKAIVYAREIGEPVIQIQTLMRASAIIAESGKSLRATELAEEAGSLIEENEAEELRNRQTFTRLLAISSEYSDDAAEGLRALLNSNIEDETLKAEASHLLFRITGSRKHREQALSIFRKLYEKTPRAWYADRISALKNVQI
ncbi:hypothetical protein CSA37_05830 [Candidatus Fermentibacteria bacterium]|nr:MAG: hypothetical protein CSA37_05830 [Candidatus Fermentibacteria bacterium]